MSIDFERNTNDGIGVNILIAIGSISPQITRTRQEIFNTIDFIRGTSDITNRSASWHGKVKTEI